ncbi:hypothetical protein HYY74_00120 [Candidatus Woesearchaeota archaeon]|nr:hypothetical protein [Candidatus Woesearchaeota archaeon]
MAGVRHVKGKASAAILAFAISIALLPAAQAAEPGRLIRTGLAALEGKP